MTLKHANCPHCGNDDQYTINVRVSGWVVYNFRFDGDVRKADNTNLWDDPRLRMSDSKIARCQECGKVIEVIDS